MDHLKKLQKLSKRLEKDKNGRGICQGLQMLHQSGKTKEEMEDIIRSLNLPLGFHLFVMGNFSDLMELKYQ
jgi:hypothetical protein